MKYNNVCFGKFICRPNRFIANVDIDGQETVCHVKNTGRCKELLTTGARVILEKADNPNRKTGYDLISVYKGDTLINMDSQSPNKIAFEYLKKLFPDAIQIKPEQKYGSSRFDFYIQTREKPVFVEVKGVTLENDGVAMFPDAPTQRGIKHLNELISSLSDGYEAYMLFIIQMSGVREFRANSITHPAFAQTLKKAYDAGVHLIAVDCIVTPDSVTANREVKIVI